jgi:hypothetical protein
MAATPSSRQRAESRAGSSAIELDLEPNGVGVEHVPALRRERCVDLHAGEGLVGHADVPLRNPVRPGHGQPSLFLCGFSVASYLSRLNVLPQAVQANA